MKIYTLEELMYKVEQHLENIEDSKTDEEFVAKIATILLEDGTYIYDKENNYVVFTPSE